MMRDEEIICLKMFPYFVLYCLRHFDVKTRCQGPDVVNILEVPRIFQKVLEYVRGPQLAILG